MPFQICFWRAENRTFIVSRFICARRRVSRGEIRRLTTYAFSIDRAGARDPDDDAGSIKTEGVHSNTIGYPDSSITSAQKRNCNPQTIPASFERQLVRNEGYQDTRKMRDAQSKIATPRLGEV
ncbi:hypothetical protein P0R31_36250 [Bradyrhizobium yuanmingense]|uniref:hypothetical protein n=1 Tax=Bradyrhizobium yuanmingense TaxID=108015 RepID=UPI0023B9E968|nr:hypothetical protein [Bradyrhizobium yuanmingense]MDF0522694.1 hypothetical protein [Bradyrhizobium yuanmingense]